MKNKNTSPSEKDLSHFCNTVLKVPKMLAKYHMGHKFDSQKLASTTKYLYLRPDSKQIK